LNVNWVEFTDRWRMGYRPAMDRVRKGELPWTTLDDLHRKILEDLLKDYRIDGLSEDEKIDWARVWRRLNPWPDSVDGLTRLMCAAHVGDLQAARSYGLRTGA
jgi:2-haloacid dehalogenase